MKLITHTYFATNIGVKFTVLCPLRLTKSQMIQAIQLQWLQMNKKARAKARRCRNLQFELLSEAAELLG